MSDDRQYWYAMVEGPEGARERVTGEALEAGRSGVNGVKRREWSETKVFPGFGGCSNGTSAVYGAKKGESMES